MSESERQLKRQRVSQACDYCRKRKSKCDGAQPICSVCRLFKKPCTYGNVKKRGLQSGYVRGLESLLGLLIEHVPGSDMTIRTLLRSDYADASFVDGEFLDRTTDRWRGSELARDLEQLLTSDGNDFGPTVSQGNKLPPLKGEQVHIQQELAIGSGDSGELQASVTPLSLNFPDATSALVDFYFQTTHCWFPVVERRDILQTLYDDGDDTPDDACGEGNQLCLWSIIAYTSRALGDDSSGASAPGPDRIHAHICSRLMSNSTIDLGHVQAVLILALHEIGRGAFTSAWVLASQAHRMRMIVDFQGGQPPGRTQRVARGCLYLDTIISALLDQTPLLPYCKNGSLAKLDENGLEEWESWVSPSRSTMVSARQPLRVLSTFNQITQLMRELSKVLDDSDRVPSLDDTIRGLQEWRSNLKKQHIINNSALTPPILTLHLTWNFVLLTSFRRAHPIERRWVPMVEGAVDSTLSMLVQYLETTGTSGSSPLLRAFAVQAEHCLHKIQPMTDGNDLPARVRLGEILQKLEIYRGRRNHIRTDNAEPFDQFEQGTVLPSQLIARSGPEMSVQNEPSTHGTSLSHPTLTGLQVPQSQSIHDVGATSSLPQMDCPPSEINEFDDVFDDMLKFVQTRR